MELKINSYSPFQNSSHMRDDPMANVLADEYDRQCDSEMFSNFGHQAYLAISS